MDLNQAIYHTDRPVPPVTAVTCHAVNAMAIAAAASINQDQCRGDGKTSTYQSQSGYLLA